MNTPDFDLDTILDSSEATSQVEPVGRTVTPSASSVLFPHLGSLKPFLVEPADSSWIAKIGKLPVKELKKRASDILMDEALPIMLNSGTINLRMYLISRFFCSRADACEIATMSRSDFSNSEVYSALSLALNHDIKSDADLLSWAKKAVVRYPAFLRALSGFIKPIASKF